MGVRAHNAVLKAGEKRALDLEPKLAAILEPILIQAGEVAAANFEALATSHEAVVADASPRFCLPAELRGKTDPVRIAAIRNVAGTTIQESAGTSFRIDVYAQHEITGQVDTKVSDAIIHGWGTDASTDAKDLAVDAINEVQDEGIGKLYVAVNRATGEVEAVANVDSVPELKLMTVENIGARGGTGAGTHLLKQVAGEASGKGYGVGLVATPESESYYEHLGWTRSEEDGGVRYGLNAKQAKKFSAGADAAVGGISFDVTNPFIGKALAQTASQITHISETTQADVMHVIRRSYEQGYSIPDTAKAIQVAMKEAAPARAVLIARTELAGAVNGGSLAATQMVVGADENAAYDKVWMTAPGAKFPRHETYDGLDGQTVGLEELFDVGSDQLNYPGDPSGDPAEVCNCRCTMRYVDTSGNEVGDEVSGEDMAASGACDAHAGVSRESFPVAYLTAAGPAGWTSPAPEEILPVSCSVSASEKVLAQAKYEMREQWPADVREAAKGDPGDFEKNHEAYHEQYMRDYARLEKEIDAADWSAAQKGAAHEAYSAIERIGVDRVFVVRDSSGKLLGVASYNPAGEDIYGINHLASTGQEKGTGTTLMREIAKQAAVDGKGIGLNSDPGAVGFYEKLGMHADPSKPGNYYFTRDETAKFARGEPIGPPSLEVPKETAAPEANAMAAAPTYDVRLLPDYARGDVAAMSHDEAVAEEKKLKVLRHSLKYRATKQTAEKAAALNERVDATEARLAELRAHIEGRPAAAPAAKVTPLSPNIKPSSLSDYSSYKTGDAIGGSHAFPAHFGEAVLPSGERVPVVIKPRSGLDMRINIDDHEPEREAAASVIARAFEAIDPSFAVRTPDAAMTADGNGSIQKLVAGLKPLIETQRDGKLIFPPQDINNAALFDMVLANTDRHLGNVGIDALGNLTQFDHGLTFPTKWMTRAEIDRIGWWGIEPGPQVRSWNVSQRLQLFRDSADPIERGIAARFEEGYMALKPAEQQFMRKFLALKPVIDKELTAAITVKGVAPSEVQEGIALMWKRVKAMAEKGEWKAKIG